MRYLPILILIILTSCNTESNKPLLIGQWEMIDWRVAQTNEGITGQKMNFSFSLDDTYEVDYGSEKETGAWSVSGNNLYTTETGMAKKMVKITKPIGDTLQFEMNRSGRIEVVTLIRQ